MTDITHESVTERRKDDDNVQASLPLNNRRQELQKDPKAFSALIPRPQVPVVIEDVNTIARQKGQERKDQLPT